MNPTILIVDDEINSRKMLQLSLERFGYTIKQSGSGEEALEAFGDGATIDLVLLDFRMPGLNGIEVLKEMLHRRECTKVIMISGGSSINTAIEAMTIGARDFLRKPFTPSVLRSSVVRALTETHKEAPIASVCREFTHTNINGFNFEVSEAEETDQYGDIVYCFSVIRDSGNAETVRVTLPAFVQELILAHIDADQPPCGQRLWEAACEERMASYLWEHGEIPSSGELQIEELSDNMKLWLNSILTVSMVD